MVTRSFGGKKRILSFKPNTTLRFGELKKTQITRTQVAKKRKYGFWEDLALIRNKLEAMTLKQLQKEVFKLTQIRLDESKALPSITGTGARLSEATYRRLGEYQNPIALKDRKGAIEAIIQARKEIMTGGRRN